MITASHVSMLPTPYFFWKSAWLVNDIHDLQNPKDDNGYKVYWENACQIIPPHDSGIATAIDENLEPWVWDEKLASESPLSQDPAEKGVIESYFKELSALSAFRYVFAV